MLPSRSQIAVVGAGLAGSSVAAALAQRDHDVVLLERDEFPRDKVCGEFLSPETVESLQTLGCCERFFEFEPPAINGARIATPDGSRLELALNSTAYGMSRRRLDELLFDHARDCGAAAFDGADVRRIDADAGGPTRLHVDTGTDGQTETLDAGLVVAAYGRRTRLDRQLQRPFFEQRSTQVGMKRHHRITADACDSLPPLDDVVELHIFDGGYCGISFVEDDIVNVCTMFDRRLLQRDGFRGSRFWEYFRTRDTPLGERLRSLEPCDTDTCAVAQIPLQLKERAGDNGVLYVGDAAGMIAPLAGDGQAMAIESGLQLAQLIDASMPENPQRQWNRRWRRRYEMRLRLGRVLQGAMTRPRLASAAISALDAVPAVGRKLVEWTRG